MCAGVLQNSRDLRVAARTGMLERRDAVPVGDGDIGASLNQRLNGGAVIAAAVAEHDGLEQGGPAEIVDVIERRLGRDEGAHDLHVSAMGSRDQRGVFVRAGDRAGTFVDEVGKPADHTEGEHEPRRRQPVPRYPVTVSRRPAHLNLTMAPDSIAPALVACVLWVLVFLQYRNSFNGILAARPAVQG